MTRYVVQRILAMILVIWVVITATFFLMRAIPGGPFDADKKIPESILRNIQARYHLDQPLWKQYLDYLQHVVVWDLGPSYKQEGRTVNDIINDGFPVSATLGGLSLALSLLIGVPAGIISALRQNKWQDYLAMFGSIVLVSVPSFILAALLMYVFALKLRWFPAALWGKPSNAVLPTLALAGFSLAFLARLTRSSMLEVIQQDYIRTARAKGLAEAAVIYRHMLKNALAPVIAYLGPLAAGVLTGSFVVETIFGIPGLGRYYVTSISNRDYTTVLGTTVFYGILLVVLVFIGDIVTALLDPRIKLEKE